MSRVSMTPAAAPACRRLMDARKQVLALQRARHVAQAERARRAREQDEGARRVLSLRQRLAGEEAQGMREMFVEALAGAKEARGRCWS